MRKLLVLLLLIAAVLAALWFLVYRPSPRYAVARLGAAVASRDTSALFEYADFPAIADAMAREAEDEAIGDSRLARVLGELVRGGGSAANPYLVSLAEQLLWTAVMRADSGPAIAGHVVGARAVAEQGATGDSAWAVVPAPVYVPEVRLDTTVRARLVFAKRDGEWVLVRVGDVARPLLRAGVEAYLREN